VTSTKFSLYNFLYLEHYVHKVENILGCYNILLINRVFVIEMSKKGIYKKIILY